MANSTVIHARECSLVVAAVGAEVQLTVLHKGKVCVAGLHVLDAVRMRDALTAAVKAAEAKKSDGDVFYQGAGLPVS